MNNFFNSLGWWEGPSLNARPIVIALKSNTKSKHRGTSLYLQIISKLLRRNIYWIPFKRWQLNTTHACQTEYFSLVLHFVTLHELIIVRECKWKWFLPVKPRRPSPSITATWECSQRKKLKHDLKAHNSGSLTMRSFLSCSIN